MRGIEMNDPAKILEDALVALARAQSNFADAMSKGWCTSKTQQDAEQAKNHYTEELVSACCDHLPKLIEEVRRYRDAVRSLALFTGEDGE